MLGSCSNRGGWRLSSGGMQQRCGSVDMDSTRKATLNVWTSEESFVSPPQYTSPLVASPESEESCEDYISGLPEEIAQSMLQEEEVSESHALKPGSPWGVQVSKPAWSSYKMGTSPSSPQSTLAGFNWDSSSNRGSSGVPSPPTPQDGAEAVDALYGELLRLKLEDQVRLATQQRMLSLQQQIIQRPSTVPNIGLMQRSMPSPLPCRKKVGMANENVLCAAIDRAMVAKQGRRKEGTAEVRGGGGGGGGGGKQVGERWGWGGGAGHQGKKGAGGGSNGRRRGEEHFSLFTSNAGGAGGGGGGGRSTLAQMQMRAVFLSAPASRECGGTGVFLPRRLGSTHHQDSRRKPGCSTVLLPSHIVDALNLNVEDTLPRRDLSFSHQRHLQNSQIGRQRYEPEEEICSSYFPMSHSTTLQEVAPNISLPSEWTY